MGFLKFLKREKKTSEFDELDLPPSPPPLEDFHESMDVPDILDIRAPTMQGPQEDKFDFTKEHEEEPPLAPPMPTSTPPENTEADQDLIPPAQINEEEQKEPDMPVDKPEDLPSEVYPKTHRRLFSQEKVVLRERPTGKTIYIKVDKFKLTLGSINVIKSDLRKSEEALLKLDNIRTSKDKAFDKMKASLDDLQSKFIFIDKTLFKGD